MKFLFLISCLGSVVFAIGEWISKAGPPTDVFRYFAVSSFVFWVGWAVLDKLDKMESNGR